jgi:hypothetical protein
MADATISLLEDWWHLLISRERVDPDEEVEGGREWL